MIFGLLTGVLGKVGWSLLTSFLTEKVLMNLFFTLAKHYVESTKTTIDDGFYDAIRGSFDEQNPTQFKITKKRRKVSK